MNFPRKPAVLRALSAWWMQGALLVLLTGPALSAHAQEKMVRLKGNLSPEIARATKLDALDKAQELKFSITFPVRNQADLDTLLQRIYTPGDPLYHHYLKTGEFADRFGPTQADYDAVIAFVKAHGLRVTETHANRVVLAVAGSSANVEKAFGVHMLRFKTANNRIFHAPDSEPAFPETLAERVTGIVGLDDAVEPRSNMVSPSEMKAAARAGNLTNFTGTGPNYDFAPGDIKAAYNLSSLTQTGTGQTIALFELDGYLASDITAYETNFGLTNVPLQNVLLNGVTGKPTAPTTAIPNPTGPVECTADVELAIALAPGMTKLIVYEGTSYTDLYNRIASDNTAQQVSSSWYYGIETAPSPAIRNAENTAFQQMAAQGQSFYAATGDYGDKVKTGTDAKGNPILQFGVQDPSAQPWVTAVGGSTLLTKTPGGAYDSELAWSGSTGGISTIWAIPTYQSAVVSPGSGGSSTYRNLPDVCLDSIGYAAYISGSWTTFAGTSAAAPLWAAYTALVNQQRAANGRGRLGFLNPTLYYLANSGRYASDFHDINSGNNGTYTSVAGYDNVTGWGSFNGGNLITDLQVDAAVLYVDGSFSGSPQSGTFFNPYQTLTAAVNAASATAPTLIYIKGNTYLENFSGITKNILFINNGGGAAVIGH